ncbi:hypothetical protein MRX96_019345 [Rhipicephalus microplus]
MFAVLSTFSLKKKTVLSSVLLMRCPGFQNETVPFAVIWLNTDHRVATRGSYVTRVRQEHLQLGQAECSGWSQDTAFMARTM